MNEIKNNIIRVTILSFFVFLFYQIEETSKREKMIDNEINNNLFITVAKVKDCKRIFSSYIYYYDKKKYDGEYRDGKSEDIGRYFAVKISKKNPEHSRIIIEEEITDSIKIANSGFRRKTLDEILDLK
jgi:hypothetical protein